MREDRKRGSRRDKNMSMKRKWKVISREKGKMD